MTFRSEAKRFAAISGESASSGDSVDFVVVGIGINVNIKKNDFDESIRNTRHPLLEEAGQNISRLDLAADLFAKFDDLYTRLLDSGFGSIKDVWLSYCDMVGKQARVYSIMA